MSKIILHIPHSSPKIPLCDGFIVDNESLENEIILLTDWFTEELFDLPYQKVITPFSRVFCDVERFYDDSLEEMSRYGMGMCYTHLDNGKLMRKLNPGLRMKIKSEYYDLHHDLFEQLTSDTLSKYNQVIIIDCHSYPDVPLNRDLNNEMPRPDFCIGTDEFHTPEKLINSTSDFLTKHGYQVKINNPYSGTIIPMKYYQKDKKVLGIMIEINRKLYMKPVYHKVSKIDSFSAIKTIIQELVDQLVID